MEIDEMIVELGLKIKYKEEQIAEKKRKVEMEEYDLNTQKAAINKITEPKD